MTMMNSKCKKSKIIYSIIIHAINTRPKKNRKRYQTVIRKSSQGKELRHHK
jgi:hypothetical protein